MTSEIWRELGFGISFGKHLKMMMYRYSDGTVHLTEKFKNRETKNCTWKLRAGVSYAGCQLLRTDPWFRTNQEKSVAPGNVIWTAKKPEFICYLKEGEHVISSFCSLATTYQPNSQADSKASTLPNWATEAGPLHRDLFSALKLFTLMYGIVVGSYIWSVNAAQFIGSNISNAHIIYVDISVLVGVSKNFVSQHLLCIKFSYVQLTT